MEPNGTNDNRVHTVLCRTGCGFYGSIACEGLCSKCYTDLVKSRQGGVTDKISCEEMTPNEVDLAASRVHEGIDADKSKSLSQDVYEAMRRASVSEKDSPSTSSSDTPQPASNTSTSAEPTAERTVDTAAASIKLEPECDEATVTAAATAASDECSVETAATGECVDAKSKKNRCHTCSKRVGLTGFACRCGSLYCSLHRYSDTHGCTFNYKELGQEDIRKNNPVVVSEKIRKI